MTLKNVFFSELLVLMPKQLHFIYIIVDIVNFLTGTTIILQGDHRSMCWIRRK